MKKKTGPSVFQWKVLGICVSVGAFFIGYIFGIISSSWSDEIRLPYGVDDGEGGVDGSASLQDTRAHHFHRRTPVKLKSCFLAIGIISGPSNHMRRTVIRQTWLKKASNELENIHFTFVIGTANVNNIDRLSLAKENAENRDLLLLNGVIDNYNNLTLKLLTYLKWLNLNVNFTYFLKADDDSFAQVDKMNQYLISRHEHKRFYWGFFDGRARVKHYGHWAEKEWILCDYYLPYAQGGGYVLSQDLVSFIVRNADLLHLYNSEDVSVGTWLSPLRINRVHDCNFDTEYESRGCSNSYLVTHKQSPQVMIEKQRNLEKTGNICTLEKKVKKSYIYNWKVPPSLCCFRNNTNVP